MKRKLSLFICLLLLFAAGQSVCAQNAAEERALRQVLETFEAAYIEEDPALLDEVLSNSGYLMVLRSPQNPDNAVVFDKQQISRSIQGLWEKVDYVEHHHTQLRIEIHGPLATTQSVIRDRFADGNTRTSPVYHILARENGTWKVVFSSALMAE